MADGFFERLKNSFNFKKSNTSENTIRNLRKSSEPQNKSDTVQSTINKLNPFLDEHGFLKYKGMNYQNLLDSSRISDGAKLFIEQATGLKRTAQPTVRQKTGSTTESVQTEQPTAKTQQKGNMGNVGFVSVKYEGGSPGRVSTVKGDYGGTSYGMSMFATNTGSADSFVKWLKSANPKIGAYFGNYKAGTAEFTNAWKRAAEDYGDSFGNLQTEYTYNNLVQPLINKAKAATGIDYSSTPALRELAYSTAVQFGGGSLGLSALGKVNSGMSEKEIVNASYDNKTANVGSYFKSSSKAVQNSVKNRFANERNDILALIE